MAAVLMFLFREGSRNAFNKDRTYQTFIKNYERAFGLRLPHLDAVEDVLRALQADELEKLKVCLVRGLLERKVFHKFRFLGNRFMIAIDGTGLHSYDHKHCEHCLHKTSASGKTTWFHHVLEAKLVTSNGLAISVCTEWIANGDQHFDKQDCEHNAFKRLAVKLKKAFPRLPICLAADGLYPNQHFFALCQQYGWDFIVTFKDGNLPSLQEEIKLLLPLTKATAERTITEKHRRTTQAYRWINGLEYKGTTLSWLECKEETQTAIHAGNPTTTATETTRFVHVTNLEVTRENAHLVSAGGRLRWKIENEGFNTQKNGGYNMEHQYSRVSFVALQNYYQCLQIAHLISQLVEKGKAIAALLQDKIGIAYMWQKIVVGFFTWIDLEETELLNLKAHRWQIRLTD